MFYYLGKALGAVCTSQGTVALSIVSVGLLFLWWFFFPHDAVEATADDENEPAPSATQDVVAHARVPREIKCISTPFGAIEVQIVGKSDAPGRIVALPDCGVSSRLCFGSLLSYSSSGAFQDDALLDMYRVVLFDYPTALQRPAEAVELLENVVRSLGIEWFVGIGMGLGADILLEYATLERQRIQGLVLGNGSVFAAPLWERAHTSLLCWVLDRLGNSSWGRGLLESYHFGGGRPSLARLSFLAELEQMDAASTAAQLRFRLQRRELTSEERFEVEDIPILFAIGGGARRNVLPIVPVRCDSAVVTVLQGILWEGEVGRTEAVLNRATASLLRVPQTTSNLVMLENPADVHTALMLFLHTLPGMAR